MLVIHVLLSIVFIYELKNISLRYSVHVDDTAGNSIVLCLKHVDRGI